MTTAPDDTQIEALARLVLLAEAARLKMQRQQLQRALPARHAPNRKGRRAAKARSKR